MSEGQESTTERPIPSLGLALIPVATLIVLLGLAYYLFGDTAASGPNQIALLFCGLVAVWVGWRTGYSVEELGQGAVKSVKESMSAIFILLAVGSLIGTWAMSGTLMAMVYWGLQILSPSHFYVTAAVICALLALCLGSSWTVAGTIGIGLMGVAEQMDLNPAIAAGAIISGSYFGDKSSPLSDCTNLATASAGSDLYTHIKEALWTSIPTLLVTLGIFWYLGEPTDFDPGDLTAGIAAEFDVSFLPFVPLVLVIVMALTRWPAFTTIFVGALAGGLLGVVTQPERVLSFASSPDLAPGFGLLKGAWMAMASGFVSDHSSPVVQQLLTRGGMESMLTTIWLILTALAFGGIIEKARVLDRLIQPIVRAAKSTGALVTALVGAGVATNILASDQYIAIVLPGRMFKKAFEKRGLAPVVLSRAVGDSSTVTSALIPWNSCGAYMAATLGVATVSFAPYAFFNYLNPIVTILFSALGIRMLKTDPPLEDSGDE